MATAQSYAEWYESEYSKIVGLDKIQKLLPPNLAKKVKDFKYPFSSIWRHEVLDTLKYEMATRKTEYICTVFRIARFVPNPLKREQQILFHAGYGFLYSYLSEKSVKASATLKNAKSFDHKLKHEFICSSPTFTSCDGEYRHRFLPYKQVSGLRKKHAKTFEELERFLTKEIKLYNLTQKNGVMISTETFFPSYIREHPKFNKIKKLYEDNVNRKRFLFTVYSISWIIEYDRMVNKRSENHIAAGYQQAMFGQHDQALFERFSKSGLYQDYPFIERLYLIFKEETQRTSIIECGQKIFPLKVKELENYGDIEYPVWREVYLTSHVGDLAVNAICSGFPIMGNWFVIQSSALTLYDNRITHVKLKHSRVASQIIKRLENARYSTYKNPLKRSAFLSYKMEGLSEAIEIPMEYAEEEIVLGDATLCFTIEHLGRTMADIPQLMKTKDYPISTGPIFEKHSVFAKYMFEYIYALYCMNSKLGIVHGDLHLNNVTLFRKRNMYDNKYKLHEGLSDPHVIYVLSPEETYIFRQFGRYSAIIDFSRAILSTDRIKADFPPTKVEKFISNQRKRLVKTYMREVPEFVEKNRTELEILLLRNYDFVFKIFTAIDSFKFARGMVQHLNKLYSDSAGIADLNEDRKANIALMKKIKDIALHYLRTVMFQALSEQITAVEFPNHVIIRECFGDFTVARFVESRPNLAREDLSIVDVFNYMNPVKYNVREYDKFPPTIQWGYAKKHDIKEELRRYHEFQEFRKYEEVQKGMEEISAVALEAKPARRAPKKPDIIRVEPAPDCES